MKITQFAICFTLLNLLSSLPAAVAQDFVLKNEDRVVFLGDTMVQEQRFSQYTETFVRVRYPHLMTRFFNSGVRNQTVADVLVGLEEDLKQLSPTYVIVAFGLYDPEFQPLDDDRITLFRKNYDTLLGVIEKLGARAIAITPPRPASPPSLQDAATDYCEVLSHYVQAIRDVASNRSVTLIDWWQITGESGIEEDGPQEQRPRGRDLRPDPIAHVAVAAALLKHWNADPIRVDITLDWGAKQISVSKGATEITDQSEDVLAVSFKDIPLPWPLPRLNVTEQESLPGYSGADGLCRFVLHVKNAPEQGIMVRHRGWELKLDAGQLEEGVNMTHWRPIHFSMPMSQLVHHIARKHNYRYKYWQHAEPRQPEEPELQEAFESLIKTLKLYEDGTARIVFRLPKTFNTTFEFDARQNDSPQTLSAPPSEDL